MARMGKSRLPVAGAAAHCFKRADNNRERDQGCDITTTGRRMPRVKSLNPSLKTPLFEVLADLPLRTRHATQLTKTEGGCFRNLLARNRVRATGSGSAERTSDLDRLRAG